MVTSSKGLGPEKDCEGPAAYTKAKPVLLSERASHRNKTVTVKEKSMNELQMTLGTKTH
jgi:hypothetical protein